MKRIQRIALVIAVVVGTLSMSSTPVGALGCPMPIAHRGNAYYGSPIENSMDAFRTSYQSGALVVETDLQFTLDNVPVLMHSRTVDATTTGTGAVASMTADQFTSLTMDDGQHPPTFMQLLDLVRTNPKYMAFVELKVAPTATQQQTILNLISGLEERVYFNAFSERLSSLQSLKTANPAVHISLLAYAPVLPSPSGIEAQDIEHTGLTAANVAALHSAGLKVRAWTPNSTAIWDTLSGYGVDGIITNKVKDMVLWKDAKCPGDNGEGGTVTQYLSNTGFEVDMQGWSVATSNSSNLRVVPGYAGGYAARSVNTSTLVAKHGIMAKPVTGVVGSMTTQSTSYSASGWVKADYVGQNIAIYVRESSGSSTIGSATFTWKATDTSWHSISGIYTAKASGNALAMHVFATNSSSQQGFLVDELSLTAPK